LKKALSRIASNLDTFIEHGLTRPKEKKGILEKITTSTDLEKAVSKADFILEAVPEIMDLKKESFERIDRFAPAHAILASNTSGLSITEIGSATRRPEKTIIVHSEGFHVGFRVGQVGCLFHYDAYNFHLRHAH